MQLLIIVEVFATVLASLRGARFRLEPGLLCSSRHVFYTYERTVLANRPTELGAHELAETSLILVVAWRVLRDTVKCPGVQRK
ncbi:hypothetical protein [Catellatospora sp. NPDC049133]|uniref:hypothetical protein n=1 Tax=Catellatospora sp. NPDC049133 TaxID=3155499 RepID=UPI0033E4A4A7